MSNTQLADQITGQPAAVEAEVLAINEDARNRSLQVALLIPVLAALLGLASAFRICNRPATSTAWTSAERRRANERVTSPAEVIDQARVAVGSGQLLEHRPAGSG
jgi:hypothetical protein